MARWLLVFGVLAALCMPATLTGAPNVAAAQSCTWQRVDSPSPINDQDFLNSIDAFTPNDIWAVGSTQVGVQRLEVLTEHWDGTTWSIVSASSPGASQNDALGVSMISSGDAWLVGYQQGNDGISRTLAEHWNGSSWTVVPTPNVGVASNRLLDVAAISPNDVWAVGFSVNPSGGTSSLAMHWDGSTWSIVATPNLDLNNLLDGITAVSSSDVWAAGSYGNGPNISAWTLHWNGSTWTTVPAQNVATTNVLNAIDSRAANDIWAVGLTASGSFPLSTLTEHWNGSAWTAVPSQSPGDTINTLQGISVVSPTAAWAVGSYGLNSSGNPLILRWDGSSWSQDAIPPLAGTGADLRDVIALSPGNVWAVGTESLPGNRSRTMVEHCTGFTGAVGGITELMVKGGQTNRPAANYTLFVLGLVALAITLKRAHARQR